MTRQDFVIKVAKINKILGELKYGIDIDTILDFSFLTPQLLMLAEWTADIQQYISQEPSPSLARQITSIGYTDEIKKYLAKHKEDITPTACVTLLIDSIKRLQSLFEICRQYQREEKGQYKDLVETLANEQVATLLQRAVDAGLLDNHFQPTPDTKTLQLRVIAFAVSSICKFPRIYVDFEKQWSHTTSYRISTCSIPKYRTKFYEYAKSLYPEVDFSPLESSCGIETFYTPQSPEDITKMYNELIKYKYIAPDTTLDVFNGIFDKAKFVKPVEWIKEQRLLAYFLYLAFGKWNKKNLWVKGGKCFLINGKAPHIACFKSGYSSIKRLGWMDRFDTRLKAICEEFNHIEETAKEKVENKGRIIHIGKEVFYSDKSEEKKQAVFSGLINGGYISPTTSIDIFMGIFDETVFTRPVLWIKSQVSLMYFVYLSFRADNPFDFWTKCANCFQIREGKPINRESLRCIFRSIISKGKLDTYDIELKRIADEYNSCTIKKEATASDRKAKAYIT